MSNLAVLGARVVQALLSRLRFPHVFLLLLATFVIDVLIPDFIPFADEIILGLVTTLVGLMRAPRDASTVAKATATAPKASS